MTEEEKDERAKDNMQAKFVQASEKFVMRVASNSVSRDLLFARRYRLERA